MKKIIILLAYVFISNLFVSCENNDDKFTGSPVGVLPTETITGVVSTNTTFALPGQTIDFTATLPPGFRDIVKDTVTVEATTYTLAGSLRRGSVDILPGQNSGTGEILIGASTGTFDLSVDLKLTAINLKKVVPGKHYLINSNTLTIASGNSSVPTENDRRLKISVDWENKTTINKLRVKMERVNLTTVTIKGTQGSGNVKIGTTLYPVVFNTDLNTTAANFVSVNFQTIYDNQNIEVTAVNNDLQFKSLSTSIPAITFVSTSPASANLKGDIYSEVIVGTANDIPKTYFLSNSKLGVTSEGVPNLTSPSPYAYTPGTYKLKIGVNTATDLAISPVDLKYRITLRYPNGTVQIFNGVYAGLTGTSGYKDVLLITKNGVGDSVYYTDVTFTP